MILIEVGSEMHKSGFQSAGKRTLEQDLHFQIFRRVKVPQIQVLVSTEEVFAKVNSSFANADCRMPE